MRWSGYSIKIWKPLLLPFLQKILTPLRILCSSKIISPQKKIPPLLQKKNISPHVDPPAPVYMVALSFFFFNILFLFWMHVDPRKVHASWLMIYGGIYMIAHAQLGNFDLMGSDESAFETPTCITLLHHLIWMPLFPPSLNILQSLRIIDAVDEEEVIESAPSE